MTEPAPIQRSHTLEKLAALVNEKKRKLADIEEKRRALQAEVASRDTKFQEFMATIATPRQRHTPRESLSSSTSLSTEEPGGPTKRLPSEASTKHSEEADQVTSPSPRGVAFANLPQLARGISRQAGQLTRGISRQAGALTRSASRSAKEGLQRVGQTSARVTRNLAKALQEDRNKMLANSVLREAAAKKQHGARGSTPKDEPMDLLSINSNAGLGAKKLKDEVAKEKAHQEHLATQIEKRMKGKRPWFARIVTLLQGIIVIVMMVTSKIAPWGISVSKSAVVVPLFVGSDVQEVASPQNPYFGPDAQTLVAWGSKWSPCMREHDTVKQVQATIQSTALAMGCCLNVNNECGSMTNVTCESFGGNFFPAQSCDQVTSCQAVTVRPCCFGILGQCVELTSRHCQVLGGTWHTTKENCGALNCLDEQCGMTSIFETSQPNQFYRFVTAMFLHVGVIHYVMNALSQYVLVAQVEFVAGWFRTCVMYVMSGAFGFLISALFSGDSLSNGSSAAIYGMLGVETVDLFQTWQLLENRKSQVIGLVVKLVLFLGIGTLPYIDNFAHIGGFLAGVVAAICFMPYISFGRLDAARKVLLKVVSVLLLVALAAGLLYKFYTTHEIECSWCQYLDCVPYKRSMCRASG